MKKLIFILAVCLCFGMTAAYADSSASELYDKRCAKCHGPDGAKTSGASGGVMLKGQSSEDIVTKLMGYKAGTYGGKKQKTMMRMVNRLSEEDIAGLGEVIGGF